MMVSPSSTPRDGTVVRLTITPPPTDRPRATLFPRRRHAVGPAGVPGPLRLPRGGASAPDRGGVRGARQPGAPPPGGRQRAALGPAGAASPQAGAVACDER